MSRTKSPNAKLPPAVDVLNKRTVWTYGIGYRFNGQPRSIDGGPYASRETCIETALRVRGELMDHHGKANVGMYELRTHQAPFGQACNDEVYPR